VLRHAAHGVVGDAGGNGAAHPGRVGQERVEATLAALGRLEGEEGRMDHVRRRGRCRCRHSRRGRSSESRRRVGWGIGSRRTSRGTTGTRRR
jgi:hypothetical protein